MKCTSELRNAEKEENKQLLELFCAVPMEGELVLTTRRDPNFFALYEMQQGEVECLVSGDQEALNFVSTFIIREGWLNGEKQAVGYLGDLRTRFSARRLAIVPRLYQQVFDEISTKHNCSVFLTSILASNQAAINALVHRKNSKREQPHYHLLRKFSATSIHFLRKRKPKKNSFQVRCAQEKDIPEIVALLAKDHQNRPFGYSFADGEFQHRLEFWPDFKLENTYLALKDNKIVGCTTVWDPSIVKRYQVEAYLGSMVCVKRFFNGAATLFRFPKLPAVGNLFHYFYLCNMSILNDDINVFRSLIEHIYFDFYDQGYHFFTLPIYENELFAKGLKGFFTRSLPFHLYAVSSSKNPITTFSTNRPGFEIALA